MDESDPIRTGALIGLRSPNKSITNKDEASYNYRTT